MKKGTTWQKDTVEIVGIQGTTKRMEVRVVFIVTVGYTQGWSFGVKHDDSPLKVNNGNGSMIVTGVTIAGTNTATVRNGGVPSFEERHHYGCGYCQAVMIDDHGAWPWPPGDAQSIFITSQACYEIRVPDNTGIYYVDIDFTPLASYPGASTILTQNGQSTTPCTRKLQVKVTSIDTGSVTGDSCTTASCCSEGTCPPTGGGGGGGGGGGIPPPVLAGKFMRADSNNDNGVDVSDAVASLGYLFRGETTLVTCDDAVDANDDGATDLSDAVYTVGWLFQGGPVPPPPSPGPASVCGLDPTPDPLGCGGSFCDGDGDSLTNDEEALTHGTDPDNEDTDNDGFTDGEEVLTTGVAGLNIAALGANPKKPDIFVEIDWYKMEGVSASLLHEHKPQPLALQRVVTAFENAPVQTVVNGQEVSTGMTLHIDAGEGLSFNLPQGTQLEGRAIVFSGQDQIASEQGFTNDQTFNIETNRTPVYQRIEEIKSTHFLSQRLPVFHYSIWAHFITGASPGGIAGIAQEIFGDDHVLVIGVPSDEGHVRMPDDPNNPNDPAILEAAQTFMHELGHNLNLRHGGNDNYPQIKRNYNSVMNVFYSFLALGIDANPGAPNACDTVPDGVIDYSRQELDPLNEACLDETKGVCVVDGVCLVNPCVPVDFNGSGGEPEPPCVVFDISDCSFRPAVPPCQEIITGWDDWNGGALRLDFRNSPNLFLGQAGGGAGGSSSEGLVCPRAQ